MNQLNINHKPQWKQGKSLDSPALTPIPRFVRMFTRWSSARNSIRIYIFPTGDLDVEIISRNCEAAVLQGILAWCLWQSELDVFHCDAHLHLSIGQSCVTNVSFHVHVWKCFQQQFRNLHWPQALCNAATPQSLTFGLHCFVSMFSSYSACCRVPTSRVPGRLFCESATDQRHRRDRRR